MPYYKENTLFKTKNNRLHIFKRKDAKTNNWYGRTFIEGKQTQTSSSTSDKNEAYKRAEKVFYSEFRKEFEYVTIVEWDGYE